MFLTRDAMVRLTGKQRHTAQRRVLDARKIPYTLGGASGREPLVREDALDGKPKAAKNREPRWDRIGAP